MTFPETLRELARLRPELFKVETVNEREAFTWKGETDAKI